MFEPWGPEDDRKRGLLEVCEARKVCSREEILERVEVIPKEVQDAWRDGSSGPWEYFAGKDIGQTHIAIDEIHNFCGTEVNRKLHGEWQKWLGEIRHRGATIEFISQHPMKVAKVIRQECALRLQLVSGETLRDPFFHISMVDWYNLGAKISGKYSPVVHEIESRQDTNSRWQTTHTLKFWFVPDLFEVYDSFSAPVQSDGLRGPVWLKSRGSV